MEDHRIIMHQEEILSDNWSVLKKYTYAYRNRAGDWETQQREVYDRGDGAAILLYNTNQNTVILTRQFRIPTYVNGNESGMMIEVCAGMLDEDEPEVCIKKETEEETGYHIENVEKVFEAYMSPGAATEILHFFVAAYTADMKISAGGGKPREQEDIEVLEINFEEAYTMIQTGIITDAKTIMLLQYAKINKLFE
ncbi:MAG: GDP-mannose pyrophosphatase NudK [Bacteroidia bacterium]|nr:GDP-mannose pyrophosphatase NudK [Bacteroidia bacterium]